jgi:hypothetical protein
MDDDRVLIDAADPGEVVEVAIPSDSSVATVGLPSLRP